MTAPALGIDPGKTGGGGLLAADGRTALASWSWSPSGDGYVVWRWRADTDRTPPSLWRAALCHVGSLIAADVRGVLGEAPDLTLCIEGLYVDPRWPATAIELAEATGALVDPLRVLASGEVLRPTAAKWRPAVLSIPANTPVAEAEAAAVRAVRAGLVLGLPELTDGHVAEGLCLARCGWVLARGAEQLELLGGRR